MLINYVHYKIYSLGFIGSFYRYTLFFDPVNIRLFGVAGGRLDPDEVAHLVQEYFGAAFHVLCSKDLHERSKDRIIRFRQTLIIQDNSVWYSLAKLSLSKRSILKRFDN